MFLSGKHISRSNGVGFLINKPYAPLIDDYQAISDRLAVLTLKTIFSKINLVQCYLPTSSYSVEDITDMYDQIEAVMDKVPKRDHLFIMGDFNAKLGGLNMDYPTAVGKHTTGKANERGELLAKFCTRNNLIVTNTQFQKLYTWTSPDGKTKKQIDFILTQNTSVRQAILDSSARNLLDISDHKIDRIKVRFNFS